MDETKKKELFPYFAYLYSQQMNPEKYGQIESMEEWIKTIQESEDDTQQIIQAAEQLTDEDWENLDEQYSQQKESNEAILAAKGAKLKKLKSKAKKCKCGCDMVTVKEKGGKMISKCSCGCGGNIKKGARGIVTPKPETRTITSTKPTIAGNITKPSAPISDEIDTSIQRGLNQQLATDSKQIGETFSQRFARERASGAKEFTWYRPNGTPYQVAVTLANSAGKTAPASKTNLPTSPPWDNRSYAPQERQVTKPTVPVSAPPAVPRSMPGSIFPQKFPIPLVWPETSTPAAPSNSHNWVRPYNPPLNSLKWVRPYLLTSQKTFPGVAQPKPFSLLRKDGGTISKQAGGPVKPTTKPAPKKTEQTPDNSPERNAAKKYKSEFYSKKGVKYDTQSGLPIAPMKPEKKQSGGDINQQIGSTKKGGKAKNRLPEKVVVVPPPALKKGKKLKSKTKK